MSQSCFYHTRNFVPKKVYPQFTIVKVKFVEKIGSVWYIYKKWKVISTIYKLSKYNFWWKSLEFSDKINQTTRMAVFDIVIHRHVICLKFGERFLTSLTMLGLQAKTGICCTIKENLPLYCRKFSAFVIAVIT